MFLLRTTYAFQTDFMQVNSCNLIIELLIRLLF